MNQAECELWEIEGLEFKPTSFHYETSKPYRLWFEYLRISPTYWLAHKHCTGYKGGLTDAERQLLPADFDDVLKTYEAFGNIYKNAFRLWWPWHGAKLFGFPSLKTNVTRLAQVPSDCVTNREACIQALDGYLSGTHQSERSPSYMLLAVPLIGNRADILKAVSNAIGEDDLQPLRPKFALAGERFHYTALSTGLRLLWMKTREPKLALWRLGVKAGVSEKYADLDITATKLNDEMREATPVLEILTSRALSNATLMMENAARGKFPCKDPVTIPKLNYRYIWQSLRRRHEANSRELKYYLDAISRGAIVASGLHEDWQDDLIAIRPEYKSELAENKAFAKQRFIEQQKALHKPREPNG